MTTSLSSTYSSNASDEVELTGLQTENTVTGTSNNSRFVLFNVAVGNSTGRTISVVLRLEMDDVTIGTVTTDVATGNHTIQLPVTQSLLGTGAHTYEAFVTQNTSGPVTYTTSTYLGVYNPNVDVVAGSADFLGLTDTPNSYASQALKIPRVNAGETALEFAAVSGLITPIPTSTPANTAVPTATRVPTATPQPTFAYSSPTPASTATPQPTATVVPTATPGSGAGTVTSVALTVPGIFSVAGSPITTSGTLAVTASGTSGGIPYFNATTTMASSAALASDAVVLGGGAGAAPTSSTNFKFDDSAFRLRLQNLTTADDGSTHMIDVTGTLPTGPTTTAYGTRTTITSAGSASFGQAAVRYDLGAGYTGSSNTYTLIGGNAAVGTAGDLNLGSASDPLGNIGANIEATGAGAGFNYGFVGLVSGSTGVNTGVYGKAGGTAAGSNIGLLGSAGNSTEGTGLKDIGVLGTTDTALPAANVSAGVLAAAAAGGFPLRVYYDDTEVMRIDDSATATHTYLMIWDTDNAQLERVVVGAADSAGTGLKCLALPN